MKGTGNENLHEVWQARVNKSPKLKVIQVRIVYRYLWEKAKSIKVYITHIIFLCTLISLFTDFLIDYLVFYPQNSRVLAT